MFLDKNLIFCEKLKFMKLKILKFFAAKYLSFVIFYTIKLIFIFKEKTFTRKQNCVVRLHGSMMEFNIEFKLIVLSNIRFN